MLATEEEDPYRWQQRMNFGIESNVKDVVSLLKANAARAHGSRASVFRFIFTSFLAVSCLLLSAALNTSNYLIK